MRRVPFAAWTILVIALFGILRFVSSEGRIGWTPPSDSGPSLDADPAGSDTHSISELGQEPPSESDRSFPRFSDRVARKHHRDDPPLDLSHLQGQIDLALDRAARPIERIHALRWLRMFGSPDALRALERIATDPQHRSIQEAVIAELGRFDDPEAGAILERMAFELESAESEADAALHVSVLAALLARGDGEARDALRALVLSKEGDHRESAARALLASADPEAVDWLLAAVDDGKVEPEIAIDALSGAPWSATGDFFRRFIEDDAYSLDLRLEALRAIGDVGGDASLFIVETATTSDAAELRASAYDALALQHDDESLPARQIAPRIFAEEDPSVRASLYDYLTMHPRASFSGESKQRLLERILSETHADARLGAATFLAQQIRSTGDPEFAHAFEDDMVPWLVESSTRGAIASERRRSTEALALSGTPAARAALEELSRSEDRDLAAMAKDAMARPSPPAGP